METPTTQKIRLDQLFPEARAASLRAQQAAWDMTEEEMIAQLREHNELRRKASGSKSASNED